MKKVILILSIILLFVLGIAIYLDIYSEKDQVQTTATFTETISEITYKNEGYVVVKVGDAVVQAEVSKTQIEIATGLSGRETLDEGKGMLFVYSEPDYYGYWMPNMNFALDIIWLSADFVVVDVTENVTPESFPQTFKPLLPAQYVLEVPSGYAQKMNINIGTQAVLQ